MRFSLFFMFPLALIHFQCNSGAIDPIGGFTFDVPNVSEGDANHVIEIKLLPKGTVGSEISVGYEVTEGTARFSGDLSPAAGTLVFKPGETSKTIEVEITGDKHPELSEYFELKINYDGNIISKRIIIADDDPLETVLSDADGFYTEKDHPSMEMIWGDEFDGNTLNANYWIYETGDGCDKGICGWGNDELETYTDKKENVNVENGRLFITALKSNGYTSGRIKTQGKAEVQYGRIDIRAKLPKGQGIWPALWMLGVNIDQAGWPACGEIDIMELVGHEPDRIHGTVHYDDNGHKSSGGGTSLATGDFSDKFHVFSIVWDNNSIEWYVDNMKFKAFTNSGITSYPFNAPFFFIINLAVGGRWPGSPDDTTVFPQQLIVDYIRVYQ